jgi:dienelactone hydrolase
MRKKALLDIIGPMPRKVPLDAKVLERVESDTYTRQLVEYSVEVGERVKAYTLIPHNIKPDVPAIFCHHQHAGNFRLGKREVVGLEGDSDQAYGHELAMRGYIIIAPDALCFEDRHVSEPSEMAPYFELASRLVEGKTLLAKVLHDISVGIEYVSSLSQVDSERIGFIGHSYGGRMALFAPAVDPRIKVSVSNCGCVSYKDSIEKRIGIQMESCVPGILQWGDVADVVRLMSKTDLLICASTKDKYSMGAQALYDKARTAFDGRALGLKLFEGEHAFPSVIREFAYSFLDQHLRQ